MCNNNGICGCLNNNWWWIVILVLLFCNCGGGCGSTFTNNGCGNGCGSNWNNCDQYSMHLLYLSGSRSLCLLQDP